ASVGDLEPDATAGAAGGADDRRDRAARLRIRRMVRRLCSRNNSARAGRARQRLAARGHGLTRHARPVAHSRRRAANSVAGSISREGEIGDRAVGPSHREIRDQRLALRPATVRGTMRRVPNPVMKGISPIVGCVPIALMTSLAFSTAAAASSTRKTITCPFLAEGRLVFDVPAKVGGLPSEIDFDYPAKATRFSFRDGNLL